MVLNTNNTNFSKEITSLFKNLRPKFNRLTPESRILFWHQYIAKNYLTDPKFGVVNGKSGTRGLLINHGLGSGKTYLAASVALGLIKHRKPVLLLPN